MANSTQQYRRRQSRPATLLTRIPQMRRVEEVQDQEELSQSNGFNGHGNGINGPSEPSEEEVEEGNYEGDEYQTEHLTRLGTPDRRFLENRALTEEDIGMQYRRANSGRVVNGIHVTEDGTPDRRYKENRALSDDDIELLKAELILQKHGVSRGEISPTAILARHASSNAVTQVRMEAPPVPQREERQAPKTSGTRAKVVTRRVTGQQKAAGGTRRR